MKNLKYFILIIAVLTACKKGVTVKSPTFAVNLINQRSQTGDTLIFKLGDTCKFTFTGSGDNVAFYAGQSGTNYKYKDRTDALGAVTLSFSSAQTASIQTGTLKVLAIKNITKTDSATIVSANWVDITSRLTLASNATVTASGVASLTDLVSTTNDYLTIAYKFKGTAGTIQPTWTITNYTVNNVLPDQTYNVSSLSSDASYWSIFKVGTSVANWAATASQLQMVGGAATNPANESWIVSRPLYVGKISRDVPTVVLKSLNSTDLTGYMFKYTAAGTYLAVFTASNASQDEIKSSEKTFIIKVLP